MGSLDERLIRDTVGALELFGVFLGTRLGLYRALHEGGAQRCDELADRTAVAPRYAREWLEQQAVAGYLNVDDPGLPPDQRRFSLPPDHVGVLVDPEDPAHLAPLADMLVGIGQALDDVAAAYRTGRGVPYTRYGEHFRRGQGGVNRPAFSSDLVATWLPAVPGLHDRLSRGGRVADVACGHGWSTQAVAVAYPRVEVVGYDSDENSVREARDLAARHGADPDRVRFGVAHAEGLAEAGPFDLVLVLEALHDMARPVEALAALRHALAPDGVVVLAEERVAGRFIAPGDEVERLMYGWSITHCLPASLADQPSAGLGTALREDAVHDLAALAGYLRSRTLEVDGGFFRLYALSA